MQYVFYALAEGQSFFIQDATSEGLAAKINAQIAAQVAAADFPDLAGLQLGGGGDGHTFVANLIFIPVTVNAVIDASVVAYLAADAVELPKARANAVASLPGPATKVDEPLAGASKGTRFMSVIVLGARRVP